MQIDVQTPTDPPAGAVPARTAGADQVIARSGPLSWAQYVFWYWSNPSDDPTRPIPLVNLPLTISDGMTVDRLRQALADCAEMFEALRTIYAKPDTSPPRQLVLERYEPPVLDATEAERVRFDLTERPGLRCVVRRDGDRVVQANLIGYGIDLDGTSVTRLARLVQTRAALGQWPDDFDPATDPATRTHPIDCAGQESTRHASRSRRALQWMNDLRQAAPRNLFAPMRDPGVEATVCTTSLWDPRLMADVDRIAERDGAGPGSVLHAMIALLLAGWSGRREVYLTTSAANRWRPDARHVIGRLASSVGCRIPVYPELRLADLLHRTDERLLQAYWHGSRDYGACRMAGVRQDAEYGNLRGGVAIVEYMDFFRDDPSIHDTVPDRRFETSIREATVADIMVDIIPRLPGVQLILTADTTTIPPEDSQRLLTQLAELVGRATERPDLTVAELLDGIDVRSPIGGAGWLTVGDSRFSLTHLRELLLGYEGVADAGLFADAGDAAALRAYVAGTGIDPAGLHEHVLVGASANPLILVPTVYHRCSRPPAERAEEASWDVDEEFVPARDYRTRVDGDERVEALLGVFSECHAGSPGDPSRSYASCGGEHLMIPSMLSGLRAAGLAGAEPADFLGLAPLAVVARKLQPVAR